MNKAGSRHLETQGGYTLVEVVVTVAISALLLGALVSVMLTTSQATNVATSRVEASSQIRNFEYFAYEDFAGADITDLNASCRPSTPCSSQPITLTGVPADSPSTLYQVTYSWDSSSRLLTRQAGSNPALNTATNVRGFEWYVDSNQTVVVDMTVTVGAYTESQSFRFFPRRNP